MQVLYLYSEGRITEYPVLKIAENKIVDLNGGGDAFVGGIIHLTTLSY